jgi:hypothetical protein
LAVRANGAAVPAIIAVVVDDGTHTLTLFRWHFTQLPTHLLCTGLLLASLFYAGGAYSLTSVRIQVGEATLGNLHLKDFSAVAKLVGPSRTLTMAAEHIGRESATLAKAQLVCAELRITADHIACPALSVTAGEKWRGNLTLDSNQTEWVLQSTSASPSEPPETVRVTLLANRQAMLQVSDVRATRVNAWLKPDGPRLSAGRMDLSAETSLAKPAFAAISLAMGYRELAFADTSGLRAGEKISGTINLAMQRNQATGWNFKVASEHNDGEVYWQPAYLKLAGHRWQVAGQWSPPTVHITDARILLARTGEIRGDASLRPAALAKGVKAFDRLRVKTAPLALTPLYDEWIKPAVAGGSTGLASVLQVAGVGEAEVDIDQGRLTRVLAKLARVNVTDPQEDRLSIQDLNAQLPWVAGETTGANVTFASARFYKVPLGGTSLPIAFSPESVELRRVRIPILDGALEIDRLAGDRADGTWPIVLSGRITPVAMGELSTALGWPRMAGTLEANLPGMVYHQRALTINGEFSVRVFAGAVTARDVRVEEALGKNPRLTGDLLARNLDLGLVTQTFKFGRIEGRIDADLANMELLNWQPNRVDARIVSSPGEFPRKISQQAVQNISSLGGAGAAAAVQRSVLRFFEEFGYEKLGVTCILRAAVCEMGGVADAPQGYVLVKGGGIPAITVLGYNRRVSWQELLRRVKGAIESNEKPVIQ